MAAPQRKDDPTLPPPWQALFGARFAARLAACRAPHCLLLSCQLNSPLSRRRSHLRADILLEPEQQRDAIRPAARRSAAPHARAGENTAALALVVAAVLLPLSAALTGPPLPRSTAAATAAATVVVAATDRCVRPPAARVRPPFGLPLRKP
jgi:hypothetical protein